MVTLRKDSQEWYDYLKQGYVPVSEWIASGVVLVLMIAVKEIV